MAHRCGTCGEEFVDEVDLKVHQDYCAEQLICRKCGEQFKESEATEDGWYYRCPNEDCDGAGRGKDLMQMRRTSVVTH